MAPSHGHAARPSYERRRPEATILHKVIRENLLSFIELAEVDPNPEPEVLNYFMKCREYAPFLLRKCYSRLRRFLKIANPCNPVFGSPYAGDIVYTFAKYLKEF